MTSAKNFFTTQDQERILTSIRQAERSTSGEIQVHIENNCKADVLDRAVSLFNMLKMHRTQQRNGVLFYLAVKDKKFAVLGDIGISEKVPGDFWDTIKEHMQQLFRDAQFADGLCDGIRMAGEALGKYFPYKKDDLNELPDDISFGKD